MVFVGARLLFTNVLPVLGICQGLVWGQGWRGIGGFAGIAIMRQGGGNGQAGAGNKLKWPVPLVFHRGENLLSTSEGAVSL